MRRERTEETVPGNSRRRGQAEALPRSAPQELYPIGALAREAGVSTRTVRYYEEIGLLKTARRYAAGRRVFEGDALPRLRFIGRLKRLGFSLEEISELNEVFELHQSTADMLQLLEGQLSRHLEGIGERMEALERMREDLASYRARIRSRLAEKNGGPASGEPREREEGAS